MLRYIFSFHFLERYGFQSLFYLTIIGGVSVYTKKQA